MQYVVNLLLTSHACVRHVMVLHADQLIWSSLAREPSTTLHRAVASIAAPPPPVATKGGSDAPIQRYATTLPDEALLFAVGLVQRHKASAASRASPAAGAFLCGAGDATQDARSAVRVPCVHIDHAAEQTAGGDGAGGSSHGGAEGSGCAGGTLASSDGADAGAASSAGAAGGEGAGAAASRPGSATLRCRLVVFAINGTSVALLLDEAATEWTLPQWYSGVAATLVPEIQPVSVALADAHARLAALDDPHRFIYFNALNRHLRTSIRGWAAHPRPFLAHRARAPHAPTSSRACTALGARLGGLSAGMRKRVVRACVLCVRTCCACCACERVVRASVLSVRARLLTL